MASCGISTAARFGLLFFRDSAFPLVPIKPPSDFGTVAVRLRNGQGFEPLNDLCVLPGKHRAEVQE